MKHLTSVVKIATHTQDVHRVGEYGLTRALTNHLTAAKKKKKRQHQPPTDALAHCHSLDKLTLLHHEKNLQIRRHITEKAELAAANEQLKALHENPTLRQQSLRTEIHQLQVQLQQLKSQLDQQQKTHEQELARVRESHQRELTAIRQQMQRERSNERERSQGHGGVRVQYAQEGERREADRQYAAQYRQVEQSDRQIEKQSVGYGNNTASFAQSPAKNQSQHQQYTSRVVEPSRIERISPKKETHYTAIISPERTPPNNNNPTASPRVYTIPNRQPSPTVPKPTYTPGTPLYLSSHNHHNNTTHTHTHSDRLTPTVIPHSHPHPLKTSSPDNTRSTNALPRPDPSPLRSTFDDFKRDLLSPNQPRRLAGSSITTARLGETDMQEIYRRYCIND